MNEKKGKTILVIEDDLDIITIFTKHLKRNGYEVIIATDGMEGLKRLEEGGYDLVITDIVMPFISGVGIVTALKEMSPHIPVIAVTGYGKEPEAAAVEKKADIVLAKPVRMSTLMDLMDELLQPDDK